MGNSLLWGGTAIRMLGGNHPLDTREAQAKNIDLEAKVQRRRRCWYDVLKGWS